MEMLLDQIPLGLWYSGVVVIISVYSLPCLIVGGRVIARVGW